MSATTTAAPTILEPAPAREAPRWLRLGVLIALALLLTAPLLGLVRENRTDDQAERVARDFLDALGSRDLERARELLAPAQGEELPAGALLDVFRAFPLRYTLDQVDVQSPIAEVKFTGRLDPERKIDAPFGIPNATAIWAHYDGQSGTLRLRKTPDGWRVSGYSFGHIQSGLLLPSGIGPALGSVRQLRTLAKSATFEALAPLTRAEFDAAWRVTRKEPELPAGRLLRELSPLGQGVQLEWGLNTDQYKQPVRLRPDGMSRVELLDLAAAAAGLTVSTNSYAIHVKKAASDPPPLDEMVGPAQSPALRSAYVGPFRVRLTSLKTYPPQPTGRLQVDATALDLPAAVRALLALDSGDWLEAQVIDAAGRSHINEARLRLGPQSIDPESFGLSRTAAAMQPVVFASKVLPLHRLFRDVDRLAAVRGRIRMPLPERLEQVQFSTLRGGEKHDVAGGRLELVKAERARPVTPKSDQLFETRLEFALGGALADRLLLIRVKDPVGNDLYVGPLTPGKPLVVGGDAGSAIVKVVTVSRLTYPFEMRDVPLPRVPAGELPLNYAPHAGPVEVIKVALLQPDSSGQGSPPTRGVLFEAVNRSNKAVEGLRLRVSVRDAAGKVVAELEESLPTATAGREVPTALLNPGAEHRLSLPSRKLPQGDLRAEVTVAEVLFLDGTSWKP